MPWNETIVGIGDTVSVGGTLWTNLGNGPGHLFPAPDLVLTGPNATYSVNSAYPQTTSGRSFVLQGLGPNGWYALTPTKNENDLPFSVNLTGLQFTDVRAMYTLENGCEYASAPAPTTPPQGECGTITASVTQVNQCGAQTFSLNFSLTAASYYPFGQIRVHQDGGVVSTAPAVIGNATFGPFPRWSMVSVEVTNTADASCNWMSGLYNGGMAWDIMVAQAVDASFMTSALPNTRYLVVSDTEGSGNEWSGHIGEIWDGEGWTVPNDEAVIFATDPGTAMGYWQMDGTTPIQVFAAIHVEYNSMADLWTMEVGAIAPMLVAANPVATLGYSCPANPNVQLVWQGNINSAERTEFEPECGFGSVVAEMIYAVQPCPVRVPVEVRFEPGGTEVDTDFQFLGPNLAAWDITAHTDTHTIVVGDHTMWGGPPSVSTPRVTRVSKEGVADAAFAVANGSGFNGSVRYVVRLPGDKLAFSGMFTEFDGFSSRSIAMLNADGTRDVGFVTGVGFAPIGSYACVTLQGSKLIVTGAFTSYGGVPQGAIARLNLDGSLDIGFLSGTGVNSGGVIIHHAHDPSTGDIICIGRQSTYDGNNAGQIFRLGHDGNFKGRPIVGTGFGLASSLYGVSVQADGKLILTGTFTSYNGVSANGIARLFPDGTLDTDFMANVGTGLTSDTGTYGLRTVVLPNGQILVHTASVNGKYNGQPHHGLARLNPDGTMDMEFNKAPGLITSYTDFSTVDDQGGLVVIGTFTSHNGHPRKYITRMI